MVRHHSKKSKSAKNDAEKKQKLKCELENLDRFAGSSDEESNGTNDYVPDIKVDNKGQVHASDDDERVSAHSESGTNDESYDEEDEHSKERSVEREIEQKPAKNRKQNTDRDESEDEENISDNDYRDGEHANEIHKTFAANNESSKSAGMANAMARILGVTSTNQQSSKMVTVSSNNNSVVLSKTTTPLQRLQQKIKHEELVKRQKRRERRSENLSALRLPLAPTAGMSAEKLNKQRARKKVFEDEHSMSANATEIANEIEAERSHRRIATRGVVALFNAISKHRQAAAAEAAAREEKKKSGGAVKSSVKRKNVQDGVNVTTKHGFLDMIKSAASKSSNATTSGHDNVERKGNADRNGLSTNSSTAPATPVGWKALKDDFMMNTKLKDWDKELSDDEDEIEDETNTNNLSQAERKRLKT